MNLRIVLISLLRRPDRKEAFLHRYAATGWPDPVAFNAVDGSLCPPPAWWRQPAGAWGCYRSHALVVEQALADGVDELVVFEDDATFVDDFGEAYCDFMARIPDDWGQAYLGGQHLVGPDRVGDGVLRANNINRTHAYVVRGGDPMRTLYRHLHDAPARWGRHHVDHHYGKLHKARELGVYAPERWLCGQSADAESDVSGRPVDERWWQRSR